MGNIFDINYLSLIRWLMPHHWRKVRHLVWLNVMCYSHILLYQQFLRSRKANLYRLMITPQVCYMERMLNDRFDYSLRRIRIEDAEWHLPMYVYQDDELKDAHLYLESEKKPVMLYTDNEAGALKDDFVVLVPSAISFNRDEMTGMINLFKLTGTTYKIETI